MNNIDILVTWVEEADMSWRHDFKYYKKLELHTGQQQIDNDQAFHPARTRDWGAFKYWFRAVEQNCPWVRKVVLVVQRESQLPKWLNRKNPKLRIVYHDEFIPKEFLPTFNAITIQAFLSNIEGLSEYYIRSDDDFYFLNSIPESMFFKDNQPVKHVVEEKLKLWPCNFGFSQIMNNAITTFGKLGYDHIYKFNHLPELRSRTIEQKFLIEHKDLLYKSLEVSKFRSEQNICAEQLYVWLFKASNIGLIDTTIFNNSKPVFLTGYEDFNVFWNYDMVCFNDGEGTANIRLCRWSMLNFFERKFPNKSSFEL